MTLITLALCPPFPGLFAATPTWSGYQTPQWVLTLIKWQKILLWKIFLLQKHARENLKKIGQKLVFNIIGGVYALPVFKYFSTTRYLDEIVADMAEAPKDLIANGQACRPRLRKDKSIAVFEYSEVKNNTLSVVAYGYCRDYIGNSNELDADIENENYLLRTLK